MNKKKIIMIIIILIIICFLSMVTFSALNNYYNELEAEKITTQVFESYDLNNDNKLDFDELQKFLYVIEQQKDNPEILNDYTQSISITSLTFNFYDRGEKNLNRTEFKFYAIDHLLNRDYRL